MLELLLLRHAKSDWGRPELADRDRDLAPRGIKAAAAMGQEIRRRRLEPDLVLCSSAVRARRTWDLASAELGSPPQLRILATLYLASPRMMLSIVHRQTGVRRLMLVGHDPGMHELANELIGKGAPEDVAAVAMKFPTGALALFRFAAERWDAVEAGRGELALFLRPRDLD